MDETIERILHLARSRLIDRPGHYDALSADLWAAAFEVGPLSRKLKALLAPAHTVRDGLNPDARYLSLIDEWSDGYASRTVAPLPPAALDAAAGRPAPIRSGVPAPLPRRRSRDRRDHLTSIIERAQKQCTNPDDSNEVWVQLEALARSSPPPPPLTGVVTSGGVAYRDGGATGVFTKRALRARLARKPHAKSR